MGQGGTHVECQDADKPEFAGPEDGVEVSVIVSTYNNPSALEKTLYGLCCQTRRDFEVLIADDGSTAQTRELVARFQTESPFKIRHVWHEDLGFRKGRILNQAIVRAAGDYLILTDGDCIPRDDFVAAHCRLARPDYYIAGGSHIDIPHRMHSEIGRDEIEAQRVFQVDWLISQGMAAKRFRYRLSRHRLLARWLDTITPRPGVLVGANASAWKNDVLAVNGFDETYTYGSDDKDLGVRMSNNGVKSRRLKYSLVCVHLAHPRTYASPEHVRENKQKLRQVRAERITWTRHGIYAGRRESGAPQEPLVTPPVPDGNPAIPECGVA
jgi:glycosyltransferase involved in cell wall biosynthesis